LTVVITRCVLLSCPSGWLLCNPCSRSSCASCYVDSYPTAPADHAIGLGVVGCVLRAPRVRPSRSLQKRERCSLLPELTHLLGTSCLRQRPSLRGTLSAPRFLNQSTHDATTTQFMNILFELFALLLGSSPKSRCTFIAPFASIAQSLHCARSPIPHLDTV
jgi:hypothetical protein